MNRSSCYMGVDVGTGSARAGIFDSEGKMLASASHPIQIWRPEPDYVEQSSEDVWKACCTSVRSAIQEAEVLPEQVKGIGFDATCSLVALDAEDRPVTISPAGEDNRNIIVWMDHRAIDQAERINRMGHRVLQFVGGTISPEMESPKLLWIKEHLPDTWRRSARFFDLPDFLTYRATGNDTRSLCSTVCKWTYIGHETRGSDDDAGCWDDTYWNQIGLGELVDEGYARIGRRVRPMGEPIGNGLTTAAAEEMGLLPGTAVGVSIIDAHAGGLGVIGVAENGRPPDARQMEERIALIGGTSSCHMAVSADPRYIQGVWGPYYSAMLPGMWLTEGGQSATGALIDFVIFSHPRADELKDKAVREGWNVYDLLNRILAQSGKELAFPAEQTRHLHVLPYFHGNRSPRANPTLRGMISGLKLSDSLEDLASLYLATIQAIAYGTRHILESLNEAGYRINTILACGGGTRNEVFLREHADITGCRVVLPREPEAVLLGAAILGGVASGDFKNIQEAMAAMSRIGHVIQPAGREVAAYHASKYRVFQNMYDHQMSYREIMT